MPHLNEAVMDGYVAGTLSEAERQAVEVHLAGCHACHRLAIRRRLTGVGVPGRPRAPQRESRRLWPLWAGAAALLVGAVAAGSVWWVTRVPAPDTVATSTAAAAPGGAGTTRLGTLSSYHGIIEHRLIYAPAPAKSAPPERTEIWEAGNKFSACSGLQASTTCLFGDGDRTWSYHLYNEAPTPNRAGINPYEVSMDVAADSPRLQAYMGPRRLARWILQAPHQVVGSETIAGRKATKIEAQGPAGPDYVWLDSETNFPLAAQMHQDAEAIEVFAFTQIDVNPKIDADRFALKPPTGYQVSEPAGKWVERAQDAAAIAGFTPVLPAGRRPDRIAAWKGRVALLFDGLAVYQQPKGNMPVEAWIGQADALGRIGQQPLVVTSGKSYSVAALGWLQGDIYIRVDGWEMAAVEKIARLFAPDLTMPDPKADLAARAKTKLAFTGAPRDDDHETPVRATYRFLTDQIGQGWWTKQDPNRDIGMTVEAHTGEQVVYGLKDGPYERIYLQRVLSASKRDAWVVTGYDARNHQL